MPRPLLSRSNRLVLGLALAAAAAPAALAAQDARCTTPDTVLVTGNRRVPESQIRSDAGILPGATLNARIIQLATRSLYGTGQFDQVRIECRLAPGGGNAALQIAVKEHPILDAVDVRGVARLGEGTVKDRVDVLVGRPLDPATVAASVVGIDSVYEKEGYYLATVKVDTIPAGEEGHVRLTFSVDEGRRLAVSGVRILGAREIPADEVVAAMETKPEGFLWFRRGEYDDDAYAGDLAERLPELYAQRGYVDFRVVRDTMIVDRETGKAMIEIQVEEGPRYKVGNFAVEGNTRFNTEDIARYYPFTGEGPSIGTRVVDVVRRRRTTTDAFDQSRWEDATQKLKTAYSNEGYIYASVRPQIDRRLGPDSQPVVDLRWIIEERQPAIVNRVEITGNDYTTEQCIRDALVLVPGDVFNQDRLLRSWQSLGNMGLFNAPVTPPDTRQANEQGDIDVVFRVDEKKTGNINFGASVGAAIGVGGFVGVDQPNLFGRCKRGSLQWQFGRIINDFNLSYTDPAIRMSRISGTVTAYRSQNRFLIGNVGDNVATGANLRFGFPVPGSYYTRAFLSYGAERQTLGSSGLAGQLQGVCNGCLRSTLGTDLQRDTRIDMPFPSAGGLQSISAQFNGGPLGGTTRFARYTTELRGFAPLFQLGGSQIGSQPIKFLLGLSTRAGGVFGDPGPFVLRQGFAMGGVMFGEMLRGYQEFTITPNGYRDPNGRSTQLNDFGRAFFATTGEFGVRFNQMFYLNAFYEAGNVWARPSQINPTRLFRGAGIGASIISPLGPLGLDYAYGFDRVDATGRRSPAWQFHFRLGQMMF